MEPFKTIVFVLFLGVAVFGAKLWLDIFEANPSIKHFMGVAFLSGCVIFWTIKLIDLVVK